MRIGDIREPDNLNQTRKTDNIKMVKENELVESNVTTK